MSLTSKCVLVGLLATSLLVAGPALAGSKTLSKSLSASGEVRINNLAGEVEIVAGSGDSIEVEARITAEGDSAAETDRLLAAMDWTRDRDGDWTLSYPVHDYSAFSYPQKWGGGSSSSRYLGEKVRVYGQARRGAPILFADLTITMPAGSELVVDTVVGPVRGASLSGRLRVDTGSGDVKIETFEGELSVDTGSGDVTLSRLDGSASIDTGSGDVDIEHVALTRLDVDTGSGDVWVGSGWVSSFSADTGSGRIVAEQVALELVDADTGSGDVILTGDLSAARSIRVDTGSGDVRIEASGPFDFDLHADLGSGDVLVGFTDAQLRRDGREVVGAVRGNGATRILVDTGSGDCIVRPL